MESLKQEALTVLIMKFQLLESKSLPLYTVDEILSRLGMQETTNSQSKCPHSDLNTSI